MKIIAKKIGFLDEIVSGILGAAAAWVYIIVMYAIFVFFGGE